MEQKSLKKKEPVIASRLKKLCAQNNFRFKKRKYLNMEEADVDRDHDTSKFSPLLLPSSESLAYKISSLGQIVFLSTRIVKRGNKAMTGVIMQIK
jgi:hypothetical protein